MATSLPTAPSSAPASEPPQPSSLSDARPTLSHHASSYSKPPGSTNFPPFRSPCLKCQPILHHSHSTTSVPTNHPADSTTLVTPAHHVTIRQYIGPLPVPASAAKAIAKAIAEDDSYEKASSQQRPQSESNQTKLDREEHPIHAADFAASPANLPSSDDTAQAHAWADPFRVQSPAELQHHEQKRAQSSFPTSPKRNPTALPPHRPRIVEKDPSSTSVLSNASFISARSFDRDALSDTDAHQRAHRPTATTASTTHLRSVSPSNKRFTLRSKKSNQTFPVSSAASTPAQPPPTSILRKAASFAPHAHTESDAAASKSVTNVRSADNLRVLALRQQRRIGSEGSHVLASTTSSSFVAPNALPILDLPLSELEEAINVAQPSQISTQPQPLSTHESSHRSNGHAPTTDRPNFDIPHNERRALNSSNDTTIIRRNTHGDDQGIGNALRTETSFSSNSESNTVEAHNSEATGPQDRNLLHPAWGQASSANAPIAAPEAHHDSVHDGSETLPGAVPYTELPGSPQSSSKLSRNLVGRGFPVKKRSLTFTGEQSNDTAQRGPPGVQLPRAVDHHRDYSRQSRMSRASTVGTFNTVGTVATEGSFGATAGTTSSLARKFLTSGSFRRNRRRADSVKVGNNRLKMAPTRTDSVHEPNPSSSPSSTRTRKTASPFAVRRRRAARSTSYASIRRDESRRMSASGTEASLTDSVEFGRARGVQPGAVGTSTGGTKWVGESFQVGQRFWHILNARRDELQKSQPCSCGNEPSASQNSSEVDALSADSDASRKKQAEAQAANVEHLKKSPEGVITLLAQQAQDISDDKATVAQTDARRERASSKERSDRHHEVPSTEASSSPRKAESRPSSRRKLLSDNSAATIQTVHPDETTALAIEARQGWSEVVSKMSSLTGELGNALKASKLDPKNRTSSPHGSESTPKAEKPIHNLGAGLTNAEPGRNGSPKLPGDSDFKILARSSSLVESDKSSAASKSVNVSLHPSVQTNGFAPRASSLATGKTPTMTRSDALSHPSPPASVEANNPELVHQLLRRKSDLGETPAYLPDAASDHAVAVLPVSSPLDLTPAREIASPYSGPLSEQDPLPLDISPINEGSAAAQSHAQIGLFKAVGASGNADRRKTVKFDTGSTRPPLKARFTASLFAGKAEDKRIHPSNLGNGVAGDAQPRPPAEVLARPQPNAPRAPTSCDSSSPDSEVCGSDTSIITRKSVLKKDRMLVKIAWTPHEDLPSDFDELLARKYSMREEDWREFVVVFRMGKLELWTDPTLTNKLVGHGDRLKLRLTIPLSRGSTFVSLFSPIDRIFCVTFQPWKSLSAHHNKRGLHLRRQGTDIVFFDCRARSVAADWMWELWRELGGLIPESLEVHVPSFGLKVRIPIPENMPVERSESITTPASQLSSEKGGLLALSSIGKSQDGGEGFKLINRNNVISMIWKLFCRIEQWKDLMEQSQKRGLRLDLAWRRGTELDWVINERTVENEPRHWAVLSGALLRDYKRPAILELRAAAHYPTSVLTAPGEFMQEPPAVEGFLWRVKPVSGALTRLYFTTYDGHIYVCRTSRAFPPDRHLAVQMQEAVDMRVPRTSGATQGRAPKASTPAMRNALTRALAKFVGANKAARRDEDVATLRQNVLEAISYAAQSEDEFQSQIEAYQSFETRRQFEQIRGSDGFIDLKHIHTIKTIGNGPVRCPGEDDIRRPTRAAPESLLRKVKDDLAVAQRDDEESDDEDEAIADIGGQEGLELAEDASDVRRARQIEITLTNGKTIRLEAFSASIAREWVERIAELVKYWRRRERADAVELMYAAGSDISELHKQLQGRSTHASGIEEVDDEKLSPILGNIWNWCQIQGCRNIIRSGRLFHKKSSYSAFKAREYVLIAGRLLCFKLVKSVRTTRARQNNGIFHRRQDTVIHLRDAYVYSGKLCEDMLKNGRSDPAQAVSGIGGGGSNSGKRHRVPRVYADGLFSIDDDEDCTFVIRYRPERVNTPANPSVTSLHGKDAKAHARGAGAAGTSAKDTKEAPDAACSVPRLDDKTHKYIAMRARSKVERDLWVRCITYEIEKIVRDDVEREKKLKNTGKVDHR
ncbi:hypothetical protein EX895_005706 [Sporisorium graminicola]|uniref:PH domain-containing protein n=1 Tax=Sporisorium graminicola TaxID=280036 RepID=A0A4U7KMW9_9BASI|nr:hypothetical protein EX895_005706 [Sporisorium graminicola]TKY85544.1 hypothetical protein EX895_005706 [Sporisorium graminicola]